MAAYDDKAASIDGNEDLGNKETLKNNYDVWALNCSKSFSSSRPCYGENIDRQKIDNSFAALNEFVFFYSGRTIALMTCII